MVQLPSVSEHKRLGDHLLEAGLINSFQLEVVMQDQECTGMRLGEILVARGWVKEGIIEDLANRFANSSLKPIQSSKHKPSLETLRQAS